jgi:hypothetical protein
MYYKVVWMKKPEELKPEVEIKLTTVGDNAGFALPKWFVQQWGLKKKLKYKVRILEENSPVVQMAKLFSPKSENWLIDENNSNVFFEVMKGNLDCTKLSTKPNILA